MIKMIQLNPKQICENLRNQWQKRFNVIAF